MGDRGDTYKQGVAGVPSLIGPDTVPSTAAYQGNVVRRTGITITAQSLSQRTMTFQVCSRGS
jgi:hypothetical protein